MVLAKQRYDVIWNRYNFPISMEGCVLDVPLWQEDTRLSPFLSYDQYAHTCTVTGATFGKTGRTFADTDKIACGTSSVLDFTSGNFTLEAIIRVTSFPADLTILSRGLNLTDGYRFRILSNGRLYFNTHQASANQTSYTAASDIATNTWYRVAAVRSGASVTFYKNGVLSANEVSGTHIDPLTNSRNFNIGLDDDSAYFVGICGEALAYNRALSAGEILRNYEVTKWRYS